MTIKKVNNLLNIEEKIFKNWLQAVYRKTDLEHDVERDKRDVSDFKRYVTEAKRILIKSQRDGALPSEIKKCELVISKRNKKVQEYEEILSNRKEELKETKSKVNEYKKSLDISSEKTKEAIEELINNPGAEKLSYELIKTFINKKTQYQPNENEIF